MALNAVFDSLLSRVRLTGTAIDPATEALFERSINNISWTTVRGGSAVAVDGTDQAKLDDYEFVPGVVNYYRVTGGADIYTTTITPSQSGVWLKSITRPFLNRAITVTGHSDITRPARNNVVDIIGRTYPVAITDVRSSRRWTMEVKTESVDDADALDLVFASGDPLFIQTDGQYDIPGGYVVVGDYSRSRFGKVSERRWFELPIVEVAPPGPEVVGFTATWDTIVADFGSWSAVLAHFGTWADVAEYVSNPDVVIVP